MRLSLQLAKLLAALALIAVGTYLLYHPIVTTDFAKVPGDMGDARLINLFLEHNYLYLFGPTHLSFWSPTWIFYPVRNGLAMSDVMTGSAPIYAAYRLLGYDPVTSYQAWSLSCAALNFAACAWLFLRLRCHWLGAYAGAFLFSYGMHRAGFLNHAQLTPSFFCPLALIAVHGLTSATKPAYGYATAAGLLAALQLWAGFYLGWFLLFGILLGLLVWLTRPLGLASLKHLVVLQAKALAAGAVVFTALSAPLLNHYLKLMSIAGTRSWMGVLKYLPPLPALLMPHQENYFYRPMFFWFLPLMPDFSEQMIFAGFIPLLAPVALLLWVRRARKAANPPTVDLRLVATAAWLALVMMVIYLRFPGGISLWWLPYTLVPGAAAIRAAGRMIHVTMIPIGFCLALGMTQLVTWRRGLGLALASLLLAGVVAESWVPYVYAYSKDEHLARIKGLVERVHAQDASCNAFYATGPGPYYLTHIDAMWASLETGKPTFNGYSGFEPPGYREGGIAEPAVTTLEAVKGWQVSHGLAAVPICLVGPSLP